MEAGKGLVNILTKPYDNPGLPEVFNDGGDHYVILISGVLLMVALSISTHGTLLSPERS